MEGLAKLKASRKVFRSHLARICGKIGELDLTKHEEETTTLTWTNYSEKQNQLEV